MKPTLSTKKGPQAVSSSGRKSEELQSPLHGMLTSLSTEIGLFILRRKSTVSDLTSSNASSPRVDAPVPYRSLSYSCPPFTAASPSPLFILNRKVSLGDTTGDTNVMGATPRPTLRGRRLSAGTTPGGSYFSPQGQLDQESSVPRASWTKKSTALLLVANMPQLQPLSLPQPWM